MTTIETHPFCHTATSFGKQCMEILGICVFSSFPLDFYPLHSSYRRVFTVFYVTVMWYDRFCRALYGDTFWPPNRTFDAQKKWKRRTRRALRSIISNFKYRYQPENTKKKIRVVGTLKKEILMLFLSNFTKKYFEMVSLHAPSNSHYAPENYIYLWTTM